MPVPVRTSLPRFLVTDLTHVLPDGGTGPEIHAEIIFIANHIRVNSLVVETWQGILGNVLFGMAILAPK